MHRIRSYCVASANYPHFQLAGEHIFVNAFGARTIGNSTTSKECRSWIVSIVRIVAHFRKGTGMGSDYAQPMHSRRVSLQGKQDKTAPIQSDILSKSAYLACCVSLRSCHPASRYRDKSE